MVALHSVAMADTQSSPRIHATSLKWEADTDSAFETSRLPTFVTAATRTAKTHHAAQEKVLSIKIVAAGVPVPPPTPSWTVLALEVVELQRQGQGQPDLHRDRQGTVKTKVHIALLGSSLDTAVGQAGITAT